MTEDPETIGAGRVLIEGGIDYFRDVEYPASGLTGHLRRFPLIGISLGIGSVGEAQIDGGRTCASGRPPCGADGNTPTAGSEAS